MSATIIDSKLPTDKHPNIVVATESKFLSLTVSKLRMAFKTEMLVPFNPSPTFSP